MPAVLDLSARLTGILREVAAALASPGEAALLAAEPALSRAVDELRSALRSADRIEPADRDALLAEILRARTELVRCRTLGESATSLAGTMLAALGHEQYGGAGRVAAAPASRGTQMQARL